MLHYHIRWSNTEIDWERFLTQEEAEASAVKLVRPDETYAIENFDGDCTRCARLKSLVPRGGSER